MVLGLGDLAGPEALRANTLARGVALTVGHADRTEVRQKATLGDAGRMKTDAAFVLG